jgi:hypothetical protein
LQIIGLDKDLADQRPGEIRSMETGIKLDVQNAGLPGRDNHWLNCGLGAGAGSDDAVDYQIGITVIAQDQVTADNFAVDHIAQVQTVSFYSYGRLPRVASYEQKANYQDRE